VVFSSLLEEGLREVTLNHPPSPLQRGKTIRRGELTSKKLKKINKIIKM
jgi:hypothetical protein